MPGSAIEDDERIVLRPSRLRWLAVVAGCAGFVAIALWVRPRAPEWAGIGAVFFGVCGILGLVQLVPGSSSLEIDREGIVVRKLFRSRALSWGEIGPFDVHTVSSNRMVVFQRATTEPPSVLAIANTWLAGANDYLPDTYGRDANELAALLNERRERALRAGTGA